MMPKVDPRTKRIIIMAFDSYNIGIQMKQKDIYDDLKFKKSFGFHGLYKNISVCNG